MKESNLPAPWATSPIEFTRSLPEMLLYLFERRHLASVDRAAWAEIQGDTTYPLIARLRSVGSRTDLRGWQQEFQSVLRSIHDPGHAFHMALHGSGIEHKMYLGTRRLAGFGARNTTDFVGGLQSACRAHIPGLEFGNVAKTTENEHSDLWEFLQTAPCIAAISGVPGLNADGGRPAGLERLAEALGQSRYAIVVAADPIPSSAVDLILDTCRTAKSEVHSYIRRTIQIAESQTSSTSVTVSHSTEDWTNGLPYVLNGLAIFSTLAGFGAGAAALQSAGMMSLMYQGREQARNQQQRSESKGQSRTQGVDIFDAHAQACSDILDVFVERFLRSRGQGLWNTATYLFAEDESTMTRLSGAYRALGTSRNITAEPLRVIRLDHSGIRGAVERGSIIQLRRASGSVGHPLGPAFDSIGTPLTSEELAFIASPPVFDMPGLVVKDSVPFSMAIPSHRSNDIALGRVLDSQNRELSTIGLPAAALNRHVFVSGMPGYGKTNTCMQILHEAWTRLGVPFLVIEPAKTEYRRMTGWPALNRDLRVYSFGSDSNPLRLNPLMPVNGIPLGRHIDMLKAVFFAAFPMQAGMPYVLEEALFNVYRDRGWRISDTRNRFIPDFGAGPEIRGSLTPTLKDLHDEVEVVLESKKYAQEIHQNMGAALRSRINSLMVGTKGLTLNCRLSTPARDLFACPSVIELSGLAEDDEKCFVMALLLVLLYQESELRTKHRGADAATPKLQHLTLIEEAHRLLSSSKRTAQTDGGDSRGKAISMFSDMLAELRALGEGFLIADQIPTDLISQVVKNTSVKIIHRLSFPDDRQLVGDCMGLNAAQTRQLNQLDPGQAVVHDEGLPSPVLVKINSVASLADRSIDVPALHTETNDKNHLFRHAGCKSCSEPCRFYLELPEGDAAVEVSHKLEPAFLGLVLGDRKMATDAVKHFRAWWRGHSESWLLKDLEMGVQFCAASDAAMKWVERWFRRRLKAGSTVSPQTRITSEEALGSVAAWLAQALQPDADGSVGFDKASASLRSTIATRPPDELPGCSTCAYRCTMLPFVTPFLRHQSPNPTKGAAMAPRLPADPEGFLRTKLQPGFHQSSAAALGDQYRIGWLHCATTNWPDLTPEYREALFVKLRQQRDEVADLFGPGKEE